MLRANTSTMLRAVLNIRSPCAFLFGNTAEMPEQMDIIHVAILSIENMSMFSPFFYDRGLGGAPYHFYFFLEVIYKTGYAIRRHWPNCFTFDI